MPRKVIKVISFLLCFCLLFQQTGFAQVAGQLDISGHILSLRNSFIQDKFRPLHLRYLSYDNQANNFRLLLDKGDSEKGLSPKGTVPEEKLKEETKTLLNYFFIGISLPNDSFWVNLRPDSENEVIDPELGKTDVGKILLEADLQLKKDTAKFTSPETLEGKKYWAQLYKKAEELFGYENITIPTLTRPWIVPDEIIIRETSDNAYIYKATLKVMLEQDYLKDSSTYNFKDPRLKALNEYSSQLLRELIIPKLTKDINSSKRYASLRQVYYSLILAQWFKQRFYGKGGLYSWLIDRKNLNGLTSKTPWSKTTYFQAYQKSFKEGEYNLKEPTYTPYGQTIRSYMSGGIAFGGAGGQGISGAITRGFFNAKRNIFESDLAKRLKYIIVLSVLGGTLNTPFINLDVKADQEINAPAQEQVTTVQVGEVEIDKGAGEKVKEIFKSFKKEVKKETGEEIFLDPQTLERYVGYLKSYFQGDYKALARFMREEERDDRKLLSHQRDPTSLQLEAIKSAEGIVKDYLRSLGLPYKSIRIVFFSGDRLSGKHKIVFGGGLYVPLYHMVVFDASLNAESLLGFLVHEILHANSFIHKPQLLSEGMTEYIKIVLLMSKEGQHDFSPRAIFSYSDKSDEKLKENGLSSSFIYEAELLAIAHLAEKIGMEPILKAYFEGDYNQIEQALGKESWRKIEDLARQSGEKSRLVTEDYVKGILKILEEVKAPVSAASQDHTKSTTALSEDSSLRSGSMPKPAKKPAPPTTETPPPAGTEKESPPAVSSPVTPGSKMFTPEAIKSLIEKEQGRWLFYLWKFISTEQWKRIKGWRICGPASIAVSQILRIRTRLPIGRNLTGNHIELAVGIYDDGNPADVEEHTYIKIYLDGKVIYVDPILNRLVGSGTNIEAQVFNNDDDLMAYLKENRSIITFDPAHSGIAKQGTFKGLTTQEIQNAHEVLVAHINSATWMFPTTPYVEIRGEPHMFEIHNDMNRVLDVIEACLYPPAVPTGITKKLSINEIFSEKSPLLELGTHQGVLRVRLNNESGEFELPVSSVQLDYPADPRLARSLKVKLGPESEEIGFEKTEIISLVLMALADTESGKGGVNGSTGSPSTPETGKKGLGGIDSRASSPADKTPPPADTEKESPPAAKQPLVEPKEDIGYVTAENGDKLYMRKGQDAKAISVVFYNESGQRVGYVDILLSNYLLNFFYVDQEFRGRDYSASLLEGVLSKLSEGNIRVSYLRAYVRNPLMAANIQRQGFKLNPHPSYQFIEKSMTEVTISKKRQPDNKIPIYIGDNRKRKNIEYLIATDPDWEAFEVEDEPIEGEKCIIFAEYILYPQDIDKDGQTGSHSDEASRANLGPSNELNVPGGIDGSTGSPSTPINKTGGVDFRGLPIVTQPMQPTLGTVPLGSTPVFRDSPLKATSKELWRGQSLDLDKEWSQIERMLNSGIIPSSQRIKEYLEVSCQAQDCSERIDRVLSGIADILRLEEERVSATEPALREMLVLLESDKPASAIQTALSKIAVAPKEPALVK